MKTFFTPRSLSVPRFNKRILKKNLFCIKKQSIPPNNCFHETQKIINCYGIVQILHQKTAKRSCIIKFFFFCIILLFSILNFPVLAAFYIRKTKISKTRIYIWPLTCLVCTLRLFIYEKLLDLCSQGTRDTLYGEQ